MHYHSIYPRGIEPTSTIIILLTGAHPSRDYGFSFTRMGGGGGGARFTIHKTTRWIELSERCGSCQSVPGSARAPTARICIIPFTSTILIGGLFQSLSPRIFALLLLSFLHTPLLSALPLSPNRRLVRLFSSNSFPLSLSFFLWRLDFTYPLHSSWFLVFFPFLCIYSWYALHVVVHHSFSWVVKGVVVGFSCTGLLDLSIVCFKYFCFFFTPLILALDDLVSLGLLYGLRFLRIFLFFSFSLVNYYLHFCRFIFLFYSFFFVFLFVYNLLYFRCFHPRFNPLSSICFLYRSSVFSMPLCFSLAFPFHVLVFLLLLNFLYDCIRLFENILCAHIWIRPIVKLLSHYKQKYINSV